MTRPRLFLALLASALLLPSIALAQNVEGTLVDSAGAPVAGALVTLADAGGAPLATVLTGADGRFELRASRPGTHRVTAERVGFRGGATAEVPAGRNVAPLRLVAAGEPVLAGALVVGDSACVVRPRGVGELAVLWDEARKALRAVELTARAGRYDLQGTAWERDEPAPDSVLGQTSTRGGPAAFPGAPPEVLAREGFVRQGRGGADFFGPNPEVILSDAFLESHCLSVVRPAEPGAGRVGVAFEPARRPRLPDVRGVLWLDETTAELRSLEFAYTNLPFPGTEAGVWGGWADLERLAGGGWIVREWSLRTPALRSGERGQPAAVTGAWRERGGQVQRVAAGGAPVPLRARGAVAGAVYDSTRSRPLAGARVYLAGTPHVGVADRQGRFRIDGVPEGWYAAAFHHPRLDSLAPPPAPVQVYVAGHGAGTVHLAVPMGAQERAVAAAAPDTTRRGFREPVALDPVVARAERRTRRLEVNGFYRRQRSSPGSFLTGDDIAAKKTGRITDALAGIRGLVAFPVGASGVQYAFWRTGDRCRVPLILDGIETPAERINLLQPEEIAGVEIYKGQDVPTEFEAYGRGFARGNDCGVVVVWTTGSTR